LDVVINFLDQLLFYDITLDFILMLFPLLIDECCGYPE
jgi:hypothetical protein